ncbi:putative endo-xylogalacturonan hydrolase A [Paramyrothecium foliicola]|nr:putative endo-xylogalacturonan hydrolase A [Paramyrothecium foliicola]
MNASSGALVDESAEWNSKNGSIPMSFEFYHSSHIDPSHHVSLEPIKSTKQGSTTSYDESFVSYSEHSLVYSEPGTLKEVLDHARAAKQTLSADSNRRALPERPLLERRHAVNDLNTVDGPKQCDQRSSAFKDEALLRQHKTTKHTHPFICIFHFAGCKSSFVAKNEWKHHVLFQHLYLKYWVCMHGECAQSKDAPPYQPFFGVTFSRKDLFTQHFRRMHSPNKDLINKAQLEEHLKAAQENALRRRCEFPTYMRCPAQQCSTEFLGANAWDERMEHVAKHLEAAAAGEEPPVFFGGLHDGTLTHWAEADNVRVVRRTATGWETCNPLKEGVEVLWNLDSETLDYLSPAARSKDAESQSQPTVAPKPLTNVSTKDEDNPSEKSITHTLQSVTADAMEIDIGGHSNDDAGSVTNDVIISRSPSPWQTANGPESNQLLSHSVWNLVKELSATIPSSQANPISSAITIDLLDRASPGKYWMTREQRDEVRQRKFISSNTDNWYCLFGILLPEVPADGPNGYKKLSPYYTTYHQAPPTPTPSSGGLGNIPVSGVQTRHSEPSPPVQFDVESSTGPQPTIAPSHDSMHSEGLHTAFLEDISSQSIQDFAFPWNDLNGALDNHLNPTPQANTGFDTESQIVESPRMQCDWPAISIDPSHLSAFESDLQTNETIDFLQQDNKRLRNNNVQLQDEVEMLREQQVGLQARLNELRSRLRPLDRSLQSLLYLLSAQADQKNFSSTLFSILDEVTAMNKILRGGASLDRRVSVEVIRKRATCTPTSLGDNQKDDTPAIRAAIQACANGGTIIIPAGKTYSVRSMLDFSGCVDCDFQLEGTLKSSTDYTFWSKQQAIILVKNVSGLKFRSLTGSGVIDGNGQSSYDAFAVSTFARPTVFYVQGGKDITVTGFKIKNPPNVFFNQKGAVTNIKYSNLVLSAVSKSSVQPRHTDGFDIGERTYTTISDVSIENQDDCIAIKSGANYVDINKVTCSGTNHGLVIGSLWKDNADFAKNIYIKDITMINCGKAAGIKVYEGGSGRGTSTVTNVTWDGVTVDGCDYGVQVQSCYGTDEAGCKENPSKALIDQIYFRNFVGTTNSKKQPVTANINCPGAGTCSLRFSGWNVKAPSGTPKLLCNGIDNKDTGITCVSGASG